jgi:MFS family permease
MPETIILTSRRPRQPLSSNTDPTPQLPPVSRAKQASVIICAFLTISLTIGYNQCYGVFQEHYLSPAQDLLSPSPSSSASPPTAILAFVGTFGAGLTWAGSIIANPLISRIDSGARTRWVTLSGVLLMTLGFLLASFSSKVWQLILTQGLLYGLGSSLLYFPLLGPAPEYFTRHRATALGVILSGGGAGGLVLSRLLRTLLSAVGARWTLRFLSALCLIIGGPVALSVPDSRFSTGGTRRRTRIDLALLNNPAFVLSVVAAFTQSAGAQLPLTFVPSYSVALGLTADTGATLLSVANAVNAVARIATGFAGDKIGRLNALVISLLVAVIAVAALWGVSVRASGDAQTSEAVKLWIGFVVVYSVAAGGYNALFPATIADIFGIQSYVAVNGFIYFIRGCGTILGSPVGGKLLDAGGVARGGSGYKGVVIWDGALLFGSTLCILGVRWVDAAKKGWVWSA